ncbi:MAG: ScpA family protein [Gammaproteobacteria bacterium]|nr:ScpA family protein [Gammaproteobacteria bacterium]
MSAAGAPVAPEAAAAAENRGRVVAIVRGQALTKLPEDLYIPPDALAVILETFEGPLDLLLYLIRRQNLDILEISVSAVTDQYMRYIELMTALELDLAGEYLLMAATLAEIKARLVLPRPASADDEEEDPRAELVRRLREYERFKAAAQKLDDLPRVERDVHPARAARPRLVAERAEPDVTLAELLAAFADAMQRAELHRHHEIAREPLSVRERMTEVLARLGDASSFVALTGLLNPTEGRYGLVVTFLALMQLLQDGLIELVQSRAYAPIHIRAQGQTEERRDSALVPATVLT